MKDTDGIVVIEADLRTKKFEQKMKLLETKLKNEEVDLEINTGEIEKIKQELSEANAEYEKFYQKNKEVLTTIDRKQRLYDALNKKINEGVSLTVEEYKMHGALANDLPGLKAKHEEINVELDKYNKKIEESNDKLAKAELKQERLRQKIDNTKTSMELLNQQEDLYEMKQAEKIKANQLKQIAVSAKNAEQNIKSMNGGLSNVINKVKRWALAVFGVRSAYMFVRQAMSTLSQYDDGLAANLNYIRYALANAIKPIVEWIVNAVRTLMTYLNYIWQAWFNKPLFPGVAQFKKDVAGANKSAKKLQRTLAGFDEMNVLSSNKNSDGGIDNAIGGLKDMSKIPIPWWVDWIAKNKDTVLTVLGALAATFAAAKVAKWISNLGGLAKALGMGSGILGLLSSIATFGAILITIMIAKAWWDDVQNFKKQLDEMREKGAKFQEEWIKKETDINKLINTGKVNRQGGYDLLEQSTTLLAKIGGYEENLVKQAEQTAVNIGKQVDKEIELYKEQGGTKEQADAIKQNIIDQITYNEQVKKRLEENGLETSNINGLNEHLLEQYRNMGGEVTYTKDELGNINDIEIKDKDMTINIDANTNEAQKKTDNWLKGIGDWLLDVGLNSFAGIWGGINSVSRSLLRKNAKGAIYMPPKLAVGGVINQPGRGIPLGSAIGGEAGAEGVIPLTDSQQMELLGEAIGRYISINLTNITELDGRQIARKVDKVRNNENFVMNR